MFSSPKWLFGILMFFGLAHVLATLVTDGMLANAPTPDMQVGSGLAETLKQFMLWDYGLPGMFKYLEYVFATIQNVTAFLILKEAWDWARGR